MKISNAINLPSFYRADPRPDRPDPSPSEPSDRFEFGGLTTVAGGAIGAAVGVAAGLNSGILPAIGGAAVGLTGGPALGMALAYLAAQNDDSPGIGAAYQAAGALGGAAIGTLAGTALGGCVAHPAAAAALGVVGGAGGALYAWMNS